MAAGAELTKTRLSGVVINNWCRPDNVRTILRSLNEQGVHEVTVVDCSGSREPFPLARNVIRYDRDPGLYARFAATLTFAPGPVLVQDDDILLPAATVASLVESWTRKPQAVHGLFGRSPKDDGSYARILDLQDCHVAAVLTRAAVVGQDVLASFFVHLAEFADVQRDSIPWGNGEDLILSYVARKYSKQWNHVYALERVELPAPNPIHGRSKASHWAHRTKLMRRLEAWLAESR